MKNIIICGPTSAGKDTVIEEILKETNQLYPGKVTKGIYYKTRKIRDGENDDGHFISDEVFNDKLARNEIIFHIDVDNYQVGYSADEFEKSEVVVVNIDDRLGRELRDLIKQKGGQSLTIFLYAEPEIRKARFMSREGWLFPEPAEYRMEKDASDPNPESHADFDLIIENKEGQLSETMKEIMPKVKEFILS